MRRINHIVSKYRDNLISNGLLSLPLVKDISK